MITPVSLKILRHHLRHEVDPGSETTETLILSFLPTPTTVLSDRPSLTFPVTSSLPPRD